MDVYAFICINYMDVYASAVVRACELMRTLHPSVILSYFYLSLRLAHSHSRSRSRLLAAAVAVAVAKY